MCTMKEASEEAGMSYETLKFYCKEGLVPNVERDKNNYRNFDEKNIAWLKSLQCLRKCGMSLKDMKQYMQYCLQGKSSIEKRKKMLEETKKELLEQAKQIHDSIAFIDNKQKFYEDVEAGKRQYTSNLIDVKNNENR